MRQVTDTKTLELDEDLDIVEQYYIHKFSPVLNKTHNYRLAEPEGDLAPELIGTITPVEFDALEQEYHDALQARRDAILVQLEEGKTQREIAKYWGLDPARVYRIIKSREKEKQ